MKQINLIGGNEKNANIKQISVMLADDAFTSNDYSPALNEESQTSIQSTCLLKLAHYFYRNAYLINLANITTPECKQVYLKSLYFIDDNYNTIIVQIADRTTTDGVIGDITAPRIFKVSLENIGGIPSCQLTFLDDYDAQFKAEEFEQQFNDTTKETWWRKISTIMSKAPIPEDDEEFVDLKEIKKNIIIALYNAAREYYRSIWIECSNNTEQLKTRIAEFNREFAGLTRIKNDYTLFSLRDAISNLEKRPLICANRSESFEGYVESIINICARTKQYDGPAYAYIQHHLNQLNKRANYFAPIEPPFGIVGTVPVVSSLIPTLLDTLKAPTNFVNLTAKRKEFEFTPNIRIQNQPDDNNPFNTPIKRTDGSPPKINNTRQTISDSPEKNQSPSSRTSRPALPVTQPASTVVNIRITPPPAVPEQIRRTGTPPAAPIHVNNAPLPRSPAARTNAASARRVTLKTDTSASPSTFGERHPILKKALIGGLIGLAVAIAAVIVIGFVVFPPGGVVAGLMATTVAASSSLTTIIGVIAGVVIGGFGIGAAIGASVGASIESKKQRDTSSPVTEPKRQRDRTSPATEAIKQRYTSSPIRETHITPEPAVKAPATNPFRRLDDSPEPARKPVEQPIMMRQPSSPVKKESPAKSSPNQASIFRRVGGSIPLLGSVIYPVQQSTDPKEFKEYFLYRYGAQVWKVKDEAVIYTDTRVGQIVSSFSNNDVLFNIAISDPRNIHVSPALVETMNNPKFKNFNIELFANTPFYDVVAKVREDMENRNSIRM